MAQMGRPRTEIDWDLFEKLCAIQATEVEIADFMRCSVDTINRACKRKFKETFAEIHKKKAVPGKISLRRTMFNKALGGNTTLLIWLSKQHLGMSDKLAQDVETRETRSVIHKWVVRKPTGEEIVVDSPAEKPVTDEFGFDQD